jgi:nicotinamide-nucleotide amidase
VRDTNTSWLERALIKSGIRPLLALTAGDDLDAIGEAIACARARNPGLIVITGGLGPTRDDLTAEAVARASRIPFEFDTGAAAMIAAALGRPVEQLEPHHLKQANLPSGCRPLPPVGTAPGFVTAVGDTHVIALPGVPFEMREMWRAAVQEGQLDFLPHSPDTEVMTFCLYGLTELEIDNAANSFLESSGAGSTGTTPEVTVCSAYGEVTLEIEYPVSEAAAAEDLAAFVAERYAAEIFSRGESAEEIIGRGLTGTGSTLAVAESCTGGMLGETVTAVSGSSGYFLGAIVCYSDAVKREILHVDAASIESEGAVSETVARQMAAGVREVIGSDYGIGVTGIAGPGGGTPEKPVGLVYVSVADAAGETVTRNLFRGNREEIRRAAVSGALHMLRLQLG